MESQFATPDHIVEACVKALKDGYTKYNVSTGIPKLKEAIAEKTSQDLKIEVNPKEEVVVMPDAKPCFFSAIVATINPGEEVLVPNPGWPIYESVTRLVVGVPVDISLKRR